MNPCTQVLNNTVTPAGHRVINYLDDKRLIAGEDWEQVTTKPYTRNPTP